VQEKTVLKELCCESWNVSGQCSRLLIIIYQKELIHHEGDCEENESYEVEDGHTSCVHLNYKHG